MKKTFYRVSNVETNQGLWYDQSGEFTGLIHDKFNFCTNNKMPMPYDKDIVGWLSATDDLEELYKWFTKEDILLLQEHGYYIHEYEAVEHKKYHSAKVGITHWIIDQETSRVINKHPLIPDLRISERLDAEGKETIKLLFKSFANKYPSMVNSAIAEKIIVPLDAKVTPNWACIWNDNKRVHHAFEEIKHPAHVLATSSDNKFSILLFMDGHVNVYRNEDIDLM